MLARTRSNRYRQSSTFADQRRRRAITGAIAVVVILVTGAFSLSRISFLNSMQITEVNAYGDETLALHMRTATLDALDGTYMGLFSRANAFLYSKTAIKQAIASTSPRIDSVAISRTGMHTLSVTVSEKAPEAVICADLPDVTDTDVPLGQNCYFADADSYLYKVVDDPDAANYMRYYFPDLPDTGVLGAQATSTVNFKRLENLVSSLEAAKIHVHAMLIQDDGSYEFYADNPTPQGGSTATATDSAADNSSLVVIQMNERANLLTERDNLIAFWNRSVSDARAAGTPVAWTEIKLQFPPNVYSRAIPPPKKAKK